LAPHADRIGWGKVKVEKPQEDKAIVIVDVGGIIRLWNARAEEWFGYSAEAAIGQSLDLIVPAEFRADHWRGFFRAMKTGAADLDGRSTPFPVLCANAVTSPFVGILSLLRDTQSCVSGAMVVFLPAEAPVTSP
jgi:PAS domain-containing protein